MCQFDILNTNKHIPDIILRFILTMDKENNNKSV